MVWRAAPSCRCSMQSRGARVVVVVVLAAVPPVHGNNQSTRPNVSIAATNVTISSIPNAHYVSASIAFPARPDLRNAVSTGPVRPQESTFNPNT